MADPLKAILTAPPPVAVELSGFDVVPRADDVLPTTAMSRLQGARMLAVALAATSFWTPILLVRHPRDPRPQTFQKWSGKWARSILSACGIGLDLRDEAHVALDQPVVYVANHQSAVDILITAGGMPQPFGFVAKEELRTTPLVGAAIAHSPSVFVDKRDPRSAVRSIKEAGARIAGGASVLVFPEGKRTYSGGLAAFQRGAFMLALEAQVPIVPVAIHGSYRVFDERRMTMKPGRVGLHLMPQIPTEGLTKRDLADLMTRVRSDLDRSLSTYESEISKS